MGNNNLIQVTMLVVNTTGLLSLLMVKAGALGLKYKRQKTERLNDKELRIVLTFNGEFDSSKKVFLHSFEELDDVIKVEKIHCDAFVY